MLVAGAPNPPNPAVDVVPNPVAGADPKPNPVLDVDVVFAPPKEKVAEKGVE